MEGFPRALMSAVQGAQGQRSWEQLGPRSAFKGLRQERPWNSEDPADAFLLCRK